MLNKYPEWPKFPALNVPHITEKEGRGLAWI
jgi:hypothetical protein